ncbi:MAG: GIY-YIG nuclease family protein [Pseudomonadota bacterium]
MITQVAPAPAPVDRVWFVYLLRCADGTLYAGITTNLDRRLAEHNAGKAGAKYTRTRRPVVLAWHEVADDRAAASRREYQLRKLTRAQKEGLIRPG